MSDFMISYIMPIISGLSLLLSVINFMYLFLGNRFRINIVPIYAYLAKKNSNYFCINMFVSNLSTKPFAIVRAFIEIDGEKYVFSNRKIRTDYKGYGVRQKKYNILENEEPTVSEKITETISNYSVVLPLSINCYDAIGGIFYTKLPIDIDAKSLSQSTATITVETTRGNSKINVDLETLLSNDYR